MPCRVLPGSNAQAAGLDPHHFHRGIFQEGMEQTDGIGPATHAGNQYVRQTPGLGENLTPRLAPDTPVRENGRIAPPEGPGLGITVDEDVLGTPIAIFD